MAVLRRERRQTWLCFLFDEDTVFLKRREKNISLFNYPQLLHLSRPLVSKESREREEMLFTCMAATLPLILLLSFSLPLLCMKQRRKIESIHWPFRQWRKEILRALLDMKIYNKNQFLDSLCSLNDKAFPHSAIVCRKVILQHRLRQERRILSDPRLQILIWYRPTEIIGGT